ncbi:MAG: anhydro-N-acetylmuramic acid kinase, partial [Candidatus Acidiferrum sp.]
DLAAGGQGVPLAALPDFLLFHDHHETRVLVHLGGIARILLLPAGGRLPSVVGFEAGPCGILLDGLIHQLTAGRETVDTGGKNAVQGTCIEPILEAWSSHPFFQRRPPKSLSRHHFGEAFITQAIVESRKLGRGMHDILCTATHFAARIITRALARLCESGQKIDRVLLSGRGVRNGLLWHLLEQNLPNMKLFRTDEFGVPAGSRQAMGFALLAALTMDGVPGNLPAATGAAGSRLLGCITPGSMGNWERCLAWMAAQAAPAGLLAE